MEAFLYGESLQSGDEIAGFDGDLCVGSAKIIVLPMEAGFEAYLEYIPPAGDPLPGAKEGNPMSFKYWDRSEEMEVSAYVVEVISGDTLFSAGGITSIKLAAWSGQMITIRPSFSNCINASRAGARLMSNCAATSRSTSLVPG